MVDNVGTGTLTITTVVFTPLILVLEVDVYPTVPEYCVMVDRVGVGTLTMTTVVFAPFVFVLTVEVYATLPEVVVIVESDGDEVQGSHVLLLDVGDTVLYRYQ